MGSIHFIRQFKKQVWDPPNCWEIHQIVGRSNTLLGLLYHMFVSKTATGYVYIPRVSSIGKVYIARG